jgi:hypothetical protein
LIPAGKTSNKLVGRWSLEAYENFQPSGSSILMTEGQSGSLEYTSDGVVHVSIRRDEKLLKSLGLSSRLANIQYRGRYEVNESNHSVFHHIEEANEPGRAGKTLIREYLLLGDRLEIVGIGQTGKVKLTWARVR